jgi:hypothetical protein
MLLYKQPGVALVPPGAPLSEKESPQNLRPAGFKVTTCSY